MFVNAMKECCGRIIPADYLMTNESLFERGEFMLWGFWIIRRIDG
jgi:hypothetical protein